uniref:LRRCT domain-containing protein n=1 Tax=Branchiostoma floridae TaxID=7739 RepID=C3XPH7_BRAFL|eukprot:XP_002613839.1 hypothetical protein BRAFLDRAFT_72039 [Branchiostoma floridae]
MLQRKALVLLLLVSKNLLLVAQQCPENCHATGKAFSSHCNCPSKNGMRSPCGWVGHGGNLYNFPVCLASIPSGANKNFQALYIKHLRSATLLEQSFESYRHSGLQFLSIHQSNISTIQPRAFEGLQMVTWLYLVDNRISNIETDAFLGLQNLTALILDQNMISDLSKHAFRGLPLLKRLSLARNELVTVPIDAILQPKALTDAILHKNHITTIGSDIMRLEQNQHLQLSIPDNKLRCDETLTWFVCNLHHLNQISGRKKLRCASPVDLHGHLINDVMISCPPYHHTNRPQDIIASTAHDELSITTGMSVQMTSAHPVTIYPKNETIATETYTDMSSSKDMSVSQCTTEKDHVILLGAGPITKDNSIYILAMTGAAVLPLILTLATLGALFIYKSSCGTESEKIDPYAVVYSDTLNPQVSQENMATDRETNAANQAQEHNDDTIQPYAVAYNEDPGSEIQPYAVAYVDVSGKGKNGKLPPYATTSCGPDQTPDPSNTIQPYTVPYDDDPGSEIQPYAVAYVDVTGKGKNGKLPPYATTSFGHDQTQVPNNTIKPYAVAYSEDPGPQLQPYSVTHEEPGSELQPHSVTHQISHSFSYSVTKPKFPTIPLSHMQWPTVKTQGHSFSLIQ